MIFHKEIKIFDKPVKKRLDFLGPLILFLITFSILSFVFFNLQRESRFLSKEGIITEGVFIESYYKDYADSKGMSKGYVSFCEYIVNEKPYRIIFSGLEEPIPNGTTLLIKYYPKDPKIREIINMEKLDEYYK